jgi:putative hydrolase of the HAD superfamily
LIRRASVRTGLSNDDIDRMVSSLPGSLPPIPDTVELVKTLRGKGHKLFILSTMPFMSIEYVEKEYPFFHLFEGIVISCKVKMIKPEPEIYRHIMAKYNLQAKNTIFIDVSEENVRAASSLGIQSMRFLGASQCEKELEKIGCI